MLPRLAQPSSQLPDPHPMLPLPSAAPSLRSLPPPSRQRQRIKYMHGDMERTGLPDASFDMVCVQFVTHECPSRVIESLVRECSRLLRPGGTLALADNNPRSKVSQPRSCACTALPCPAMHAAVASVGMAPFPPPPPPMLCVCC